MIFQIVEKYQFVIVDCIRMLKWFHVIHHEKTDIYPLPDRCEVYAAQ